MKSIILCWTVLKSLKEPIGGGGGLIRLKPNSWTENFVKISEHNLASSQTCGNRIQCIH